MTAIKELIVEKAKERDTTKYSTISIRVTELTKSKWAKFCKDNKISQQATFEAILNNILGE